MNVPEKLSQLIGEIDEHGHANLTRLTGLKSWFKNPARLPAFAVWVAARVCSRPGKTNGEAARLFREARTLLKDAELCRPRLNRRAAAALHTRLRAFQNEHERSRWGSVRLIRNWNLKLIEQALDIYLWRAGCPPLGYALAADWCRNFDGRHGNCLNLASRMKLEEIARFILTHEAWEAGCQ